MYELRVNGRTIGLYQLPEQALARVRALVDISPDWEPEVLDKRTGLAVQLAASTLSRDELAAKM